MHIDYIFGVRIRTILLPSMQGRQSQNVGPHKLPRLTFSSTLAGRARCHQAGNCRRGASPGGAGGEEVCCSAASVRGAAPCPAALAVARHGGVLLRQVHQARSQRGEGEEVRLSAPLLGCLCAVSSGLRLSARRLCRGSEVGPLQCRGAGVRAEAVGWAAPLAAVPVGAPLLGAGPRHSAGCRGGRIGGVLLSFYVTLCSKKKHKNKKRKRDEDAEEQLDIVGEQLSGNYVILWQL